MSPKVSRKYLWKIAFYCVLLGGLIGFILYLQNKEENRTEKQEVNVDEVETIDDFTIEH